MITTTRTFLLALAAGAMLIVSPSAEASKPKFQLIEPGSHFHHGHLPKLGFRSYTIHGVGERVTFVRWNGLAARLGLERGDTILALNDYPLTYHGAWRHALRQAVRDGGWIQLAIWDVRTGGIAYRDTYLGWPGFGPGTPKSHHYAAHGPVTSKSYGGSPKNGSPKFKMDLSEQLEKLANLKD